MGFFFFKERYCQLVLIEFGCGFIIFFNIVLGSYRKLELVDNMKFM